VDLFLQNQVLLENFPNQNLSIKNLPQRHKNIKINNLASWYFGG
jgi:hypothetical protein